MINDSKVFAGFKIKGLRLKNQKNLQEVAKALDITPSYLSSIENGKKSLLTKFSQKQQHILMYLKKSSMNLLNI